MLLARILPPQGMARPKLAKLFNQDQHLFVVWDDDGDSGYNLGRIYQVAQDAPQVGNGNTLLGSVSQNDLAVDAKASDELALLRTADGDPELSKWDTTGRLWRSTTFDTEGRLSWPLGINGAGSRVMVGGRTSGDQDWRCRLLDGADDTVSSSHYAGVQNGSHAEIGYDNCAVLSRDGDVILAKTYNPGFHAYRISTTTVTHNNTTCQSGNFDTAFFPTRPGLCALSGDGAEGIVIDGQNNRAFILTGGPASYTETTIFFPNSPRACAISNDGTKAVVLSRALDTDDGGLTVTVIDMTTQAIALTSGGVPIRYQIHNPSGRAHGHAQFLVMSDDGSSFGFGTRRNLDTTTGVNHASVFHAASDERAYQPVHVYRPDEHVIGGDYATSDGEHLAVCIEQSEEGRNPRTGYVDLFDLS
ncbi:MAG: hypothetical protein CMH55_07675 [Myxococcales bacterium]|nr:hypothetical protein [Myxococcales bacterium]